MDPEILITTDDGVDLTNAVVVIGTPTLGQVGTITAHYIVDQLDMDLVGGVRSHDLPPVALVSKGRPGPPLRIYHRATACGMGLSCERLVVITGEALPQGPALNRLVEKVADWCVDQQAEMVVLPDSAVVESEGDSRKAFGVATNGAGTELLAKLDIELLDGGLMRGFSAALLNEATHRKLAAVAMLAETVPKVPDARAAARLVECLDEIVPDIKLEHEPLLEKAKQIEARLQEVRDQMRKQRRQELQEAGADPMVR